MTQIFERSQSVRLARRSFDVSQYFEVGRLGAEASATRTHPINRVLGGRSFSSDKTNQREAPARRGGISSCADSSAQAVKNDAHKSSSVYERSSSHGPPATAFLIQTLYRLESLLNPLRAINGHILIVTHQRPQNGPFRTSSPYVLRRFSRSTLPAAAMKRLCPQNHLRWVLHRNQNHREKYYGG